MEYSSHRRHEPEARLADYLEEAHQILDSAARGVDPDQPDLELTDDFEHLRWFPLPGDSTGR
jgi:hypothetical protein